MTHENCGIEGIGGEVPHANLLQASTKRNALDHTGGKSDGWKRSVE